MLMLIGELSPEELSNLITKAVQDGVDQEQGRYIIGMIAVAVVSLIGAYLGAYLSKKGENAATKEDIHSMESQLNEIRNEYAKRLDDGLQRNRLMLAGIDKRLAAHQAAYGLIQKLRQKTNDVYVKKQAGSEIDPSEFSFAMAECNDFYSSSCLYLTERSRQAFSDATDSLLYIMNKYVFNNYKGDLKHSKVDVTLIVDDALEIIGNEISFVPTNKDQ